MACELVPPVTTHLLSPPRGQVSAKLFKLNDVIFLSVSAIMLASCLILLHTYYALFNVSIICAPIITSAIIWSEDPTYHHMGT